jgi:hypothetical protein
MNRLAFVFLALVLATAPLDAQAAGGDTPPQGRRQLLERQIQQRIAQIVRRELDLDDAGMRRLQRTNQRFERERRRLLADERETRRALRTEVTAGPDADQGRVDEMIGRLLQLQRERIDLIEAEQRELATFLTPVQRARYLALQEQLRRRVEEMRARRLQRDSARP